MSDPEKTAPEERVDQNSGIIVSESAVSSDNRLLAIMSRPKNRLALIFGFAAIAVSLVLISHAASPTVTIVPGSYTSTQIYHSPQTPGFTPYVGAWLNPDKSLGVAFNQETGLPLTHTRDFSSLTGVVKYIASTDSGTSWTSSQPDDSTLAPNGVNASVYAYSAQAMTRLKNGCLIQRVNGDDVHEVDKTVIGTAYVQAQIAPACTQWGPPQYLLPPASKTYQISRIQYVSDGRLIATGQVWDSPANTATPPDHAKPDNRVQALVMVSSDDGATWSSDNALTFLPSEPCLYPNEWDASEVPDGSGDLIAVFRSRSLATAGQPCNPGKKADGTVDQVRNQALLKKTGAGWTMTQVKPQRDDTGVPLPHSGHPELLTTKEGVVLNIAYNLSGSYQTVIHYSVDNGATWKLLVNDNASRRRMYYPVSVQDPHGGLIYIFGAATSGDNNYGDFDQSITMDTFKINVSGVTPPPSPPPSPLPPPPPVDTTPPNTTISAAPATSTTTTIANFSFTASEANSSFKCKLDSAALAACASPKSYSGLTVGSHSFSVQATDPAGNVDASPASQAWAITPPPPPADKTPPNTILTGGTSGRVASATASFQFTSTENNSTFVCQLDNAPFAACTSPKVYTNLTIASHAFRVKAIDPSGNMDGSPATRGWIVTSKKTSHVAPNKNALPSSLGQLEG